MFLEDFLFVYLRVLLLTVARLRSVFLTKLSSPGLRISCANKPPTSASPSQYRAAQHCSPGGRTGGWSRACPAFLGTGGTGPGSGEAGAGAGAGAGGAAGDIAGGPSSSAGSLALCLSLSLSHLWLITTVHTVGSAHTLHLVHSVQCTLCTVHTIQTVNSAHCSLYRKLPKSIGS